MNKKFAFSFIFILLCLHYGSSQNKKIKINEGSLKTTQNNEFEISNAKHVASILYDVNGSSLDSITAHLLANDIFLVTGKKPVLVENLKETEGNFIAIGELQSAFIQHLINDRNKLPKGFLGQRESYTQQVVNYKKGKQGLIIAGTDPRGTAYGVFSISKKIGVSPWYWWADVPVLHHEKLSINQPDYFSEEPSVEYRGIFLNDEDWGLQPWAAKTFEPETGDIGPKTYGKIFELLLRLRANTIWPAMHRSTKAFFHYPGNPKIAEKFHIVVGSSHAEPMLRNNVFEWNKKKRGAFNYVTNKKNVDQYWEERVKQAKGLDAFYTMGMRGIHDSGMEGTKNTAEGVKVLEEVIKDQRNLLKKYVPKPLNKIPQVLTVYKEVLKLYDHGLKVPDDITIGWTDDNYGYIRRLSNEKERKRSGGGGVYYHASYWGRPHDYLWLSTTSPSLIREEMRKAYLTDNKKLWILNVGDIKPAEYNLQLFMDMAWDISKFKNPEYLKEHRQHFYTKIFGKKYGGQLANIRKKYYQLAFQRKPEFMGWSQTEPTTQVKASAFNPFWWGDELHKRVQHYEKLEKEVGEIGKQLPKKYKDTYYQLIEYPVKGAALMNKKWLYWNKAQKYAQQNRIVANDYQKLANQAYDSISLLTDYYNHTMANGKWNFMMSDNPRKLPVFHRPDSLKKMQTTEGLAGVSVENPTGESLTLPVFYNRGSTRHFFDVYLKKETKLSWLVSKSPDWLKITKRQGKLDDTKKQQRVFVNINWKAWEKGNSPKQGLFKLKVGQKEYTLYVKLHDANISPKPTQKSFLAKNGVVSIYAEDYSTMENRNGFFWKKIPGLGYSNAVMQAGPVAKMPLDTLDLTTNAPKLTYTIYTEKAYKDANLILNALPTHPITNKHKVRVGVQWDNRPVQIVDFKTFGRSEEWKQNVLRNLAKRKINLRQIQKGKHQLKLYMIDEGVSMDFIYLKLNRQVKLPYGLLPETHF